MVTRKSTRDLGYCATLNRGPHPLLGRGTPFEKRTSFKGEPLCL